MRQKLALILAFALILTSTAACAQSASDTIIIATDAAFPPMEFVNDEKEIVGFDIDLMNAIAEEMDLTIEFKNTAWDGIFAGLDVGDYDAILSAVTIRPDRQENYDFSEPYINAGQAIVVRADEEDISGAETLAGETVGAQIGTTGAFAVEDLGNATLKEYDTIDLAFLDLVNGNVDAVVVDSPLAWDYALISDQFVGRLKIVGEPMTEECYGLMVRKGENQDLLQAFNEGLEKIKQSGKYDEIYDRWIGAD